MLDPSIVGQRDLPWMGRRPADVAELWVFPYKITGRLSTGLNLGVAKFPILGTTCRIAREFLMCL